MAKRKGKKDKSLASDPTSYVKPKRTKSGKRKWGNTNRARAKIRQWIKAEGKRSGLPPSRQWREMSVFQLSEGEADDLQERWLRGEVKLGDNVVEQFEYEQPEIYRYEFDIKWRPETQDDPLIAYNSKDDFLIKDLFTARGRHWRQLDRGDHIEGWNADFDYYVFDIDTPQMAAKFGG